MSSEVEAASAVELASIPNTPAAFFVQAAAESPDLAADIEEVQETAFGKERGITDGALAVAAVKGRLTFTVDSVSGVGKHSEGRDKSGTGAFKGSKIPTNIVGGGTFTLEIQRTKATLTLKSKTGSVTHVYHGTGLEKGLTGTWVGSW
ncbi:hypothetical protein SERLADRAFT_471431 [Serpula lacrymans var. lacrymans S7.9]|uniref:Uncharacterized protein n=1 Tax=Serpula lacrymans var. lacrymans (strain S7.9) TaxID=578457 RepID=F8P174_SERL9|nr:uncharacterized protein SERLADRAFT_471431 [Serpula lacrymans var. lacrymans S7.9]EGO22905.1 hypothetical protein SERLADRAFT_471431 [Serpula lacrymans var. lacrymans S7.9]